MTGGLTAYDGQERTTDDILAEYQDRVSQRDRLQNFLADPDNDLTAEERQYYTDAIVTHNNIIADLAQEALDAGVTQADLDAISAQAGTDAGNDPIDLEEFTPEWIIDDVYIGWMTGIGHGYAMIGNHLTLNSYFGWIDGLTGIEINETIDGWVEDGGDAYWWANESARVGAHALHLAGAVYAYQVFVNPSTLYHFTSTASAESIQATGTINMGSGLFGNGVYASSINSPLIATIMGAKSTEAVIIISAGTVTKYPTLIPGAWRIIHNVIIK